MKTKLPFGKTASAAGLALLLITLVMETISPPLARAAAPVALTLKGAWPGHARGPARDVAVQGQYAYVAANEGGLIIIDVSDPVHLVPVGGFDPGGGPDEHYFQGVAVSGDYAYAADGSAGLQVLDVSDPGKPQHVASYDTGGYVTDVAVSGDYAYVADGEGGLQVFDISDPRDPVRVGGTDDFDARAVVVSGNYAYVAKVAQWDSTTRQYVGGWGLRILDVSDPTRPVPVGSYETTGPVAGVAVSGNHIYLAEGKYYWPGQKFVGGAWHVLDVSNPTHPVRAAGVDDLNAVAVSVVGDYAYVSVPSSQDPATDERLDGGLLVFDVSDPVEPKLVGHYEAPIAPGALGYGPHAVVIVSQYAFVADSMGGGWDAYEGDGLTVIDVSNPAKPVRLSNYKTYSALTDLAVGGDYAYVTEFPAGLAVIDVSNSIAPTRVGSYTAAEPYSRSVSVADEHAFVLMGARLQILDVSDPVSPLPVGATEEDSGWEMAAVAGGYAYVVGYADSEGNGLHLIDISDPTNPVRVGGANTKGDANNVAVAGRYVYVMDGDYFTGPLTRVQGEGFLVFDIQHPRTPVRVGRYAMTGSGSGALAVAGDCAYVMDNPRWDAGNGRYVGGGFHILDVSDPAQPVRVGGLDNIERGWEAAVSGNHVYLAASWSEPVWGNGLLVIDVSDPANPMRVAAYETAYIAGIAARGDLLYGASDRYGLQIFELSRPPWLEVSGLNPFTVRVSGEPGAVLRVQRSSNLQDWEDWQTFTLGDVPVQLSDPNVALTGARFFRALQP